MVIARVPAERFLHHPTPCEEEGQALVVFQKPSAWDAIDGGLTTLGTLTTILNLLPSPVQIEQHGILLIVVEYETWKRLVRQKQAGEGSEYV